MTVKKLLCIFIVLKLILKPAAISTFASFLQEHLLRESVLFKHMHGGVMASRTRSVHADLFSPRFAWMWIGIVLPIVTSSTQICISAACCIV